jgi:hypothetical protein
VVAKDPHWNPVTKRGEGSILVLYFKTISNGPQFKSLSPADGSTGLVLRPTLSWSASDPDIGDTITYDVYFGDTTSPPLVVSNQTATYYQPAKLLALSTYYWKIVARDNNGVETVGPILSFTTGNPADIVNITPNPCYTKQIVSIYGVNFGNVQSTSVIHLEGKKFRLGNAKILFWSDTRIDLKIPAFKTWSIGTSQIKNLWVTVNGLDSNKIKLTIIRQ